MDDLKSLTVRYLRELARKHLGKGYTRLKTKDELIAALRKVKASPADKKKASKPAPAAAAKNVSKPSPSVPAKIVRFAKKAIDRSLEVTVPGKRPPAKPVPVSELPRAQVRTPPKASVAVAKPPAAAADRPTAESPAERPEAERPAARKAADEKPAAEKPAAQRAASHEAAAGEAAGFSAEAPAPVAPLVEGFFVARVAGEGEVRRHHLTEEQARPVAEFKGAEYDEKLGELPDAYEDDSAVLLPRDPNTLFFFWDYASATRAGARTGLANPRAVIRVFEGDALVREVEFALESKSFYIHDLPAGRSYRVEATFVGDDGRAQRVGTPTNVVALPAFGPSSVTTVRFLRIPWTMPLRLLRQYLREGRAKIEQLAGEPEYVPVVGFAPPGSHPWSFGAGPRPSTPRGQGGWFPPPSGRPY